MYVYVCVYLRVHVFAIYDHLRHLFEVLADALLRVRCVKMLPVAMKGYVLSTHAV